MGEREEKEFFEAILLQKPSWKGLAGSDLVDIITSYFGQRLDASLFQIDEAAREGFLQLARRRESITARAESEGYIPKLPTPFELEIEVKNEGSARVFLPFRMALIANDQTGLVLSEDAWVEAGETITVRGQQLSREFKTFTSAATLEIFQSFVIGGLNEQGVFTIHDFSVKIDGQTWENRQSFLNGGPESLIYHKSYKLGDELAFMLGNNEVGKIPPPNSEITVEIWHTKGEEAFVLPGQNLSLLDAGDLPTDINGNPARLKFTSGVFVRKGQAIEPVETIRKSVLGHIQQEPMAARNVDYEYKIRRLFPELLYLKVWGEKEQIAETGYDLAHINKGFFTFLLKREDGEIQAAYDARVEETRDQIIEHWENVIRPMNVTAEPVSLQELAFQIKIKGKIDRGDPLSNVESELTKLLTAIFGRYGNQEDFLALFKDYGNVDVLLDLFARYGGRAGRIQESDVHRVIDATGYFENKFPQINRGDRPGYEVELTGDLSAAFFDKYIFLDDLLFEDGEGSEGLAYVANF